ncbi:EXS-domain-containing protein [Backusella circina FSU 941]|nr:EXS-domain-containing protein [Backusella circina FSU 941]
MTMFLCPFDIFYYSARKWLCATLGRVCLSYCFPVEFRDFFIADELNSLSYSIWTSSYFFCAYSCHWKELEKNCSISTATGFSPFLAALPPWWRLLQCFRRFRDSNERVHLFNAAKYINGILVAFAAGLKRIYPSFTSIWIIISICNSCYTCIWDIKMDWGLCRYNKKNLFLRDEIVFYKWTYYVAIILNILLRFSWIIMALDFKVNGQLLGMSLALLEIYRRIQWNFFRLENEHLNNCGQYRAIKDIQLPFQFHASTPLHDDLFYGVRDFENKQDDDEEAKTSGKRLVRKNSNIESILSLIKSVHEGDRL